METKLKSAQFYFLNNYKDNYSSYTIDCSVNGGGRAGGLAILWNHCILNLHIINSDLHYIDMLISDLHNTLKWRATGIYGYPQAHNKFLTCKLINDLSCFDANPNWLIFGDFNITLTSDEKFGGNPLDPNITSSFRNTLSLCNLQDLGYTDSIYTWSNRQHDDGLIKCRLDRFLANPNWITMFPHFINKHLVGYKSDHCPIFLEFTQNNGQSNQIQHYHCKRFEQVWTTNAHHSSIVKETWSKDHGEIGKRLHNTLNQLHNWGRKTFGTIPKRIKESQQELEQLLLNPNSHHLIHQIAQKEQEIEDLMEKEEIWWSQRSRALWLTHGDKNTKYFHQKASQRRRKNKIDCIKDSTGITHKNQEETENIFITHFQQLFTSQGTHNITETTRTVQNRINAEMMDHLSKDFTADEVVSAIKGMKGLAAPGPDGLPAIFYHTYWDIIGPDIINMALNILNNGGDPSSLNTTHICLIPKTNNPSTHSEFRPISLCNVSLKIITKTIANRIKPFLNDIISPNQSAFVPGRLITDNTLIANEVFHYLSQTTRQTGYVGIKTDMAKAYDRLEWDFLHVTLTSMNFPQKLINTILNCVTTVSFSILINGRPTKNFKP
jgi:hypothetical protein